MTRTNLVRIAALSVIALVLTSLQPWRPAAGHGGALHDIPHFAAYFWTALLLLLAARGEHHRTFAPLAVVALGIVIEWSQHRLYRGPFEWRDLAADVCAALLVCLLARHPPFSKS